MLLIPTSFVNGLQNARQSVQILLARIHTVLLRTIEEINLINEEPSSGRVVLIDWSTSSVPTFLWLIVNNGYIELYQNEDLGIPFAIIVLDRRTGRYSFIDGFQDVAEHSIQHLGIRDLPMCLRIFTYQQSSPVPQAARVGCYCAPPIGTEWDPAEIPDKKLN